ncbi:conserved hypothetical protein [Candidatus Sulfopaludibacter sp. SbA3]|nr:conserved hypothetical protein [Candidatus Sulfopaludibacter sp. SbA3]
MGVSARILVNCHTQLEGHTGDRALLAEAGRLREAVRRTSFLLQTATDYHMTWFRILRAKTGGYTAHGDPALVSCSGRVCLQG